MVKLIKRSQTKPTTGSPVRLFLPYVSTKLVNRAEVKHQTVTFEEMVSTNDERIVSVGEIQQCTGDLQKNFFFQIKVLKMQVVFFEQFGS